MKFYLGSHNPGWLWSVNFPLFISRRRLSRYKRFRPAAESWALDSGGFSELSMYGEWRTSARQYVDEVKRYQSEIGKLDWASVQDWMCEPWILQKTGQTIAQHQEKTIDSFIELKAALDFAWAPVLQGWQYDDYRRHYDRYQARGIDLQVAPIVGIGSICRRQATDEAVMILRSFWKEGINLHGFGFKTKGLKRAKYYLESADSMAWSYDARRANPLPECTTHINCANCLKYAIRWRDRLLTERQMNLFD